MFISRSQSPWHEANIFLHQHEYAPTHLQCQKKKEELTFLLVLKSMFQDDPKLPDDSGEIPKFKRRGWRFNFWLRNLPST